ncbi:MAG: hypothetical protein ABR924_08430 [Terracidiphilus sp.]|jgi:hypothetical protein
MPVLNGRPAGEALTAPLPGSIAGRWADDLPRRDASAANPERSLKKARPGIFQTCANPGCASGWLHLWRSRATPVLEGGWSCSAACTAARVAAAVRRELDARGSAEQNHRHRVPLGLLMMEQGWITSGQLRQALGEQKGAGAGRLGQWLVRRQGVSEQLVTRALGLQWSCPVLPLEFYDPEALSALVPRLFVDAFGALPLRVAAGKLLYLGFEERLDPVLALAIERMTGLRVESGLVPGSQFRLAHARMLSARFPRIELIEAGSEPAAVHALSKAIERVQPAESRLVRAHECLWLRMWPRPQVGPLPETASVEDLICSIGTL